MHGTSALSEADRLMTVCNSCRYCEGICAVFPAMEMRRVFPDGDLNYIANLCHGCGACYYDCQFSPPHEFNVNVPQVLAVVRAESWQQYAWPSSLKKLFERNGLVIALIASLSVTAFIFGFVAIADNNALFRTQDGPGAFYRVMPHSVMAVLFTAAFLYGILAAVMSVRAFWADMGGPGGAPMTFGDFWQALRDASQLRYLDGGGVGCYTDKEEPTDRRRFFHHFTFYGFLLCFASTCVATLYHYLLGFEAPYPVFALPVVLGILGGIGLIVGPLGLYADKLKRDPALQDSQRLGMDVAFIAMLFLTSVTGFLLLVLRGTPAMGILLAVHLGVVFSLFVTMPYGKFMHGLFRFAALMRYAREKRVLKPVQD